MGISKRITQSAKNRHVDNVIRTNHGNGLQHMLSPKLTIGKHYVPVANHHNLSMYGMISIQTKQIQDMQNIISVLH